MDQEDSADFRGDALLESLTLLEPSRPKLSGSINKIQVAKVSWSHKDMADFMLANPQATQNQIAERYGYTPHWVSTVIHSDAFQCYLASRRSELCDPTLILTIQERMQGMTHRAVEVLQEKLALPAAMVSDELALRAAALGAKSLGMGISSPPPPPPQTNMSDKAHPLAAQAPHKSNQRAGDV